MTKPFYRRSMAVMGTIVTIDVAGAGQASGQEAAAERASKWFRSVEACCSRFDPESELMQLSARIGVTAPVSGMLYEAVQFALAVAESSGGAFDPTVGRAMQARGFNREYRSGREIHSPAFPLESADRPSYKDVILDPDRRTITLPRPLVLDLGAVAKGLAIDMAARELQPFGDFAIDAGGDLYLGGLNPEGAPWSVGIRHPRSNDDLLDFVRVSGRAVCTSGDYERRAQPGIEGHHILDARTGQPANAAISATVIAPSAMLADALATAAFVLGPAEGISFLERMGVEGMVVSEAREPSSEPGALQTHVTRGLKLQALANARPMETHIGGMDKMEGRAAKVASAHDEASHAHEASHEGAAR